MHRYCFAFVYIVSLHIIGNMHQEEIARLKKERDALVLAHNFAGEEAQRYADFVGSTDEILRRARNSETKAVVVCGARYLAESIAALCYDKAVLLPDEEAGCPMVKMLDLEQLRKIRKENPGIIIISYVKSSLEAIAESDYCCTARGAAELIKSLDRDVLFVGHRYLARNLAALAGRKVSIFGGYCPPHLRILPQDVREAKTAYPKAKVLAHIECRSDVLALADFAGDTREMYGQVKKGGEFIVASESGFVQRLQREFGSVYPASTRALCPNVKLADAAKIYRCLEELAPQIKLPESLAYSARKRLDEMLVREEG